MELLEIEQLHIVGIDAEKVVEQQKPHDGPGLISA
jgi:hypothetical protein